MARISGSFRGYTAKWQAQFVSLCYLTEPEPGYVLAASMWIDRESYPGQGLFNAQTEGCLPMGIYFAD